MRWKILFLLIFICSSAFAQEKPGQIVVNNNDIIDSKYLQTQQTDKLRDVNSEDLQELTKDEVNLSSYSDQALLQGLNKITARTSLIDIKLNQEEKFGNLKINLHACWIAPPEEEKESKALIEIWEEIIGEEKRLVFSGWMFSSSPLISAPQHPVYDIVLIKCTGSRIAK